MRRLTIITMCLWAGSALADDQQGRVRYEQGGQHKLLSDMNHAMGSDKAIILPNGEGYFSLGVSQPQLGRMSLGHFGAFTHRNLQLRAGVENGADAQSAAVSAHYQMVGLGLNGIASLRVGIDSLHEPAGLNPAEMGIMGYSDSTDLSVSLSYSHSVLPNMSLGGFMVAEDPNSGSRSYRFGAGMGLKF